MKRIIILVFLAFATLPVSLSFGADTVKLGSVDIQKILLLSDSGKDAKEQLAFKASKYEAEKNVKEEALRKLKIELEKQSILLSESARNAKSKDYQQKVKEYQRFMKDAQDDLKAENDELTNKIVESIVKVIQEYGRKNAYSYIFVKNEGMMIYVDAKSDLTEELLRLYNESHKK